MCLMPWIHKLVVNQELLKPSEVLCSTVLIKLSNFADVHMESPKNSIGESEEASSKNSTFDRVLPGDLSRNLLFSSVVTSQVKMNPSYLANPSSTWTGISNPLAIPMLLAQPANLSHMGSGPIFAHSWTE
jgi:hypothetical protein